MTPEPNLAAVSRKARCRMTNRTNDRCQNEAADPDPATVQICPKHALEAALMLQDCGAIKIAYRNITARRTA